METLVAKHKIEKNGVDVFVTDEYDLFKHKIGNRPIDPALVKKIYNSILEHGWFASSIIVVGDGLVVLDGQHRIEALKMFAEKQGHKYRVKYVVDRNLDDLKKITVLQTARKGWTNDDYAKSYIAQGDSRYQIYLDFREEYKMPRTNNNGIRAMSHSIAIMILANTTSRSDLARFFKEGDIRIFNIVLANKLAMQLNEISKYFIYATHNKFVSVMISLWNNPLFDHNEFIRKLSRDREKLYRVGSEPQYFIIIEDIYNFSRQKKISFTQHKK